MLLAGGLYSAAHTAGAPPRDALTLVFSALLAVCLLAFVTAVVRRPRSGSRSPIEPAVSE